MSNSLRKFGRAAAKLEPPEKIPALFSAAHEAAHAVTALAVGAEVGRVCLTPKPFTAFPSPESLDEYALAVAVLAGPLTDQALGLEPRPGDADYVQWLLEPPTRDWVIFASCAWAAVGIKPKNIVGQNSCGDCLANFSREEVHANGAEINAWATAATMVASTLCHHNRTQITAVAAALLKQPSGLTGKEVRAITGPLTAVSPDRLHEMIDNLALDGLDAGAVAWREHKKLWENATWEGWDQIEALKAVQP